MKHLFLYTLTMLCITAPTDMFAASGYRRLTRQESASRHGRHPSLLRTIAFPREADRTVEISVSLVTTMLAGIISACDFIQKIQNPNDYLEACKNKDMAKWVMLYNSIWWSKKFIACNEIYRVGARIHQDPHNLLECIISLLKIVTICGERVAEPEHIAKASRTVFGEQSVWKEKAQNA